MYVRTKNYMQDKKIYVLQKIIYKNKKLYVRKNVQLSFFLFKEYLSSSVIWCVVVREAGYSMKGLPEYFRTSPLFCNFVLGV